MRLDHRRVPDVLAFSLVKAREILEKQNFPVEVVIYGEVKKPGEFDLRVARQKVNPDDTVEIVVVYALDEVIDEV